MIENLTKTSDDLFAYLGELEIPYKNHEHRAVFTVDEGADLRDQMPGGHTKNLFVKDKKGRYFLLTVEEHASVDLKQVHTLIGASGRVSFGKPEPMMEYLGVQPGSVTALAAMSDTGKQVTFVLDADLMKCELINCHPLRNTATISIHRDDLLRFIKATGHEPLVLKVTA